MKFTLKDYQADAVDDVLKSLERAKQIYDVEGKEVSVSLTATTGAGKTVMAAAAIEALFYGNETFNFDADPGAVVIWFSDDPNLNDQTRFRLMEASDKLTSTDLVTIEPPFAKPQLDPGKVYFLNTQKLSKSSLLTRGHVEVDDADVLDTMTAAAQPDLQGWTIWETIANTIDGRRPHRLLGHRRGTPGLQHQGDPRQGNLGEQARQRALRLPGNPDRVGHLRDDRAVQGGHVRRRRKRLSAGAAAGHGGRLPRPGVRSDQGHRCPGDPGRGWQLRHRPCAAGCQEAARLERAVGAVRAGRRGRPTSCDPCS